MRLAVIRAVDKIIELNPDSTERAHVHTKIVINARRYPIRELGEVLNTELTTSERHELILQLQERP